MGKNDIEAGATKPLLNRRWLAEYEKEPVGGWPGNHAFRNQVMLAFRTAFFGTVLACVVWMPETKPYVDQSLVKYIPVSVLMIFFSMSPVFGGIVGNATAALLGTFFAVFNIFMMRGFFSDGRVPGDSHFSPASIAGWLNVMIFNFIFVGGDFRPGVKLFAMANNTGFMLAFLNPADQTVFSKNFKINPNGTAVNCLKITAVGCFLTMLANLLPVPYGFATKDMKANARRVSAYVAKNFISSVDYYSGSGASIIIEKQLESTQIVEAQVGSLGGSIGSAWYEGFDIGSAGTVRKLHEVHSGLMGSLLEITKAIEIAIKTEDFTESHIKVMNAIGGSSAQLANNVGDLLMTVTDAAADGDISASEKADLKNKEVTIQQDLKALAKDFNAVRQEWDPIHKELLNESFFVFALSAYARKVSEYSQMMRENTPKGESVGTVAWQSFKSVFTLEGASPSHGPIAARCWLAVLIGFIYGVFMDNYGGACAVTVVFLQSTRVAPDILASLKCLQAVVIACVLSAIIFANSCKSGYGDIVLPLVSFSFWWLMLYVAFSGCSFATIGILSAGLSPFTLVVRCPPVEEVSGSGGAVGLWIGIRGFILALCIMSLAEFFSASETLAKLSYTALNNAIVKVQAAMAQIWIDEDPTECIGPVGGLLGDAKIYGSAAVQEPRTWRAKWKFDLMDEVATWVGFLKLDVSIMRAAMCGADGKTGGVFEVLNKVPAFDAMKKDLEGTIEQARQITFDLLSHEWGAFGGMSTLNDLDGLSELDGYDEAIKDVNTQEEIKFPEEEILTIEDDLLCQISIIFVMLDYQVSRVAHIIGSCVKHA